MPRLIALLAFLLLVGCTEGNGALIGSRGGRTGEPTLVAIGDSISYGAVERDGQPGDPRYGFPTVAAKKLGAKLVNLAVGGATCEQVLSNQVPNIPVDATFITIDCGTNDFDHDLKDAPIHDRVIDAAHQRAPSARLIIVLLHGVGYAPLNAHLREVAANYGAPVVDPNTITNVMDWPAPPGGIGLHPNAEAARIIGEAVAEGVTGTRDSRLSGKFP